MLFQNLKAIGEELSEISVLYCKYIYIFIYIDTHIKKEVSLPHPVFHFSFQAMFTGGLKECEMSRVKLQGVCPTAMARILHFMYTGQIRVTEVTVCQLLPAATMFQV
jgi:hypothetical protein